MRMRSAAVIKTWIHNQIRSFSNEKQSTKLDTNDAIQEEVKKIFAQYISTKTIPSISECAIAYKSKISKKLSPADIQDMILKEIHGD